MSGGHDLSRRRLGGRIRELRELRGLSQQELASKLGVSRPVVSQIEAGTRKVSADEVIHLSEILNCPVEAMLIPDAYPEIVLEHETQSPPEEPGVRISVPQKNLRKFREVLLYILNKVGSKPNVGETVIYKLLYFIDFDYYENYEEQLIGATYIKNHHGPTPREFTQIVGKMIEDGDIVRVKNKYYNFPQRKYLPLRRPDLSALKAVEIKIVDDVLNRLSDLNANQISDYSHKDVPWLSTKTGEVIQYESVFYRTPPYSVRQYGDDPER